MYNVGDKLKNSKFWQESKKASNLWERWLMSKTWGQLRCQKQVYLLTL